MSTTLTPELTGTYTIDPSHSRIGFVARHAMVTKVRGSFNEFTGSGYFDAEDPSKSKVELTIQANSIDTRNADRDGHLKSADFFDVERFPRATFASTRIEARGDGRFDVTGDLTLRDVTRPVTLAVELTEPIADPWGNVKRGVSATARIDRKDFGLNWNSTLEAGGVLVGDQVDIAIEVELVKQA